MARVLARATPHKKNRVLARATHHNSPNYNNKQLLWLACFNATIGFFSMTSSMSNMLRAHSEITPSAEVKLACVTIGIQPSIGMPDD